MFDLDVPYATIQKQKKVLDTLYELGYRSIALSEESDGNMKKCKPCSIPYQEYMNEFNKNLMEKSAPVYSASQLNPNHNVLNIYTRLNINMDNPAHNYSISNQSIVNTYHLIAVKPSTEKLFQMACQQLEIDIIQLDMSVKLPFPLKNTNINMAIQRGIVFEIGYGQAIRGRKG
jgi:ribonuclease P/MRP protein subunit RPP1